MLEVCFSDSAKACLRIAQHCGSDNSDDEIDFITDKKGLLSVFAKIKALKEYRKRQIQLKKKAVLLGGSREDIVGISFGLSEGDINSPIYLQGCPRKDYIRSVFSFCRYEKEAMDASIEEFWADCINDLQKLKSNPPQIRVWVDSTPDAQCGLLFISDLLKGSDTEFHIVELPKKIMRYDNAAIEYRSWGEVEPLLYGTFLDNEKILTEKEVFDLAARWELLKAQNSPLRVVENNAVISADISYYDDLIRREFPKTSCKIAHIVGSALGKQNILTGDAFIANRIKEFIKAGELRIVSSGNDGFYSAVVECAN